MTGVARNKRFAGIAIGSVIAAALLATVEIRDDLATPLRLAVAAFVVLLLPGLLAVRLLPGDLWGEDLDALEKIPLAFAITLTAITLTTILAITLHASTPIIATLWIIALAAAAVVAWRQAPGAAPAAPIDVWGLAVLIGLLPLMFFLYGVGGFYGPLPDSEEELHLLVTRKLLETPRLATDSIFYKPATATTYLYPAYHFLLALVSRLSGLDPIIAYVRLRPLWAALALLGLYGTAKHLFGSRRAAGCITLLLIAMALSGRAGLWRGPFGRLLPFSHHADWSLGVLVPIGLFVLLRFLNAPGRVRGLYVLCPLLILAITIIHTREGVQFIGYLAAAILAGLLLRDKLRTRRAAAALAILVTLAVPYKRLHEANVDHLVDWEGAELSGARQMLQAARHDWRDGAFGKPLWERSGQYAPGWEITTHAYIVLGLVVCPALLASRHLPLVMMGFAVVGWWLIVRVPVLALASIVWSYSQLLFSPVRYVLHFAYLAAAAACYLAVLLGARIADREQRSPATRVIAHLAGMLVTGAIVAIGLGLGDDLAALCRAHLDTYLKVSGLLLAAALIARHLSAPAGDGPASGPAPSSLGLGVCLATAFAVLAADAEPASRELNIEGGSLANQYAVATARPNVDDLGRWYSESRYTGLSWPLVDYIRRLPPNRVFALPASEIRRLPVLANQYVFSFGSFLSTEMSFTEAYAQAHGLRVNAAGPRLYALKRLYENRLLRRFPFYSPDSDEMGLRLLREFQVEYLVCSQSRTGPYACFPNPAEHPLWFTEETRHDGLVLYRVKAR